MDIHPNRQDAGMAFQPNIVCSVGAIPLWLPGRVNMQTVISLELGKLLHWAEEPAPMLLPQQPF